MADASVFRRIALSFEGAAEYPHFDRRAFKARVTFATLAPDELSANVKFAPDEQALKCAVAPDAFVPLDNAWGRRGWTRATLAALNEAELRAALEMAWRHAAPKAKAKARKRR
jgi:YjbR protein